MIEDIDEFAKSLESYVGAALAELGETADYCTEALQVLDARNHLFTLVGKRPTDESDDVYALRDLCRIDEETMELRPDRGRIQAVARNFF